MKTTNYWFLKRGDNTAGPFPSRVIGEYLVLGRLHDDDLISRDKKEWRALAEFPDLYPEIIREKPVDPQRLHEERIKLDERMQQRRAAGKDKMADERRKARDRRSDENADFSEYRQQRTQVINSINEASIIKKDKKLPLYLVSLSVILVLVALVIKPGNGERGADCQQSAAPGVDWSYCKLQGVDLTNINMAGAILKDTKLNEAIMMGVKMPDSELDYAVLYKSNLGFADLSSSSLKGVDFRDADLSYVNFNGADLSYADLSGAIIGGADFTNARLDNTIWIDKKTCLRGSLGECRLN